ncbi:hypothetical protein JMF97_30110 [Micromonospora fiedleri]|uniref:Transcription regulator TrmB N-terminal domain-containing protein n=1 Tax=Micromonospora fiedleri TaxID=1157498 RepID=A0ABS1UVL2_9ACTN|nr:helix-turn-helix domain-containing protein [Micromonospora fiedleri]MBL6280421.1 hypothetical protein [Micromonospora fiedleri]
MSEVIGLTPAEEELYRCLVQLTTTHIDELTERLHRPRTDIITHLDALRAKGLVLPAGPEPDAALRPLAPDVPLGRALLRQQEALECSESATRRIARSPVAARHTGDMSPGGHQADRRPAGRCPSDYRRGLTKRARFSDGSPASPAPAGRTWPPADR